ncbi:MAG: hypothetical protein LBB91_04190 [Clostridiales bacterium]|jgi:hypothetical protein|nr:hypothetical protein [Clostridiales bacterium]
MKRKWLFFGMNFLIVILSLLFAACNKKDDENDDWSILQKEGEVIFKVAFLIVQAICTTTL